MDIAQNRSFVPQDDRLQLWLRRMKKTIYITLSMAIIMVAMSFSMHMRKPQKGKVIINTEHFVGEKILKLDSVTYTNESGQAFTVTKFKYYISNIRLKNKSGKDFISKESYLIDQEEDKKQIILNDVPAGNYSSLDFIIGVDSLRNCSGAQSGALDPVNAMFWAWNTGYIFLKLEGRSPSSRSPGNIFEFHIGGYKQPSNCIRKVNLGINASVSDLKPVMLNLKADVLELFKTPKVIDLQTLSSVTDFHNATTIADNYCDMFTLLPH